MDLDCPTGCRDPQVQVGPGYVEPAAKKAKKEGSDKAAMGSMGSMG